MPSASVSSNCVAYELIRPQIDSLLLAYACPVADAVRNAFEEVPAWTEHLNESAPLKARLDAVFGTAGLNAWASCVCSSYPIPHTHSVSHSCGAR